MSWLKNLLPKIMRTEGNGRGSVPEGLWTSCTECKAVLYRAELERNLNVCIKCSAHMRLGGRLRVISFLDENSGREIGGKLEPEDFLKFKDSKRYRDRIVAAQKKTGETDALVVMEGTINQLPVIVAAFDFSFMGGSMGSVVGERFTRAAEACIEHGLPLVNFSASGGARMQEALVSLMQMAKTSAVIERMKQQSVPYISVMTDPIYGGVSASLALLGDINVAEPDARAGFAGPNIIEQTIRQKLPKGFQRSEFLLEHGAIDMIVHRNDMRDTLARILSKLSHRPVNQTTQELPGTEGEMAVEAIEVDE